MANIYIDERVEGNLKKDCIDVFNFLQLDKAKLRGLDENDTEGCDFNICVLYSNGKANFVSSIIIDTLFINVRHLYTIVPNREEFIISLIYEVISSIKRMDMNWTFKRSSTSIAKTAEVDNYAVSFIRNSYPLINREFGLSYHGNYLSISDLVKNNMNKFPEQYRWLFTVNIDNDINELTLNEVTERQEPTYLDRAKEKVKELYCMLDMPEVTRDVNVRCIISDREEKNIIIRNKIMYSLDRTLVEVFKFLFENMDEIGNPDVLKYIEIDPKTNELSIVVMKKSFYNILKTKLISRFKRNKIYIF